MGGGGCSCRVVVGVEVAVGYKFHELHQEKKEVADDCLWTERLINSRSTFICNLKFLL